MKQSRAVIKAISSYFPVKELTNEELAHDFGNWDADKILKKIGIAVRRIAADDVCASDLAVAAARRLFQSGMTTPDDIDFLLFCSQSPDYFFAANRLYNTKSIRIKNHLWHN